MARTRVRRVFSVEAAAVLSGMRLRRYVGTTPDSIMFYLCCLKPRDDLCSRFYSSKGSGRLILCEDADYAKRSGSEYLTCEITCMVTDSAGVGPTKISNLIRRPCFRPFQHPPNT